MLLLVVDASRGPHGDWIEREVGPTGLEHALAATDAAVDAAARYAADAFENMVKEWQDSVIKFRCSLKPADVIRLGGPAQWNCSDVRFSLAYLAIDELPSPVRERLDAIPTRLTLSAEEVDAAIAGARDATQSLPFVRRYLQERVRP